MNSIAAGTALDKVIAKAIRRLVPFLLLMYVLAFLDRANVGFAKKAFQLDTGLSDAVFAFGAGVFFIGYALFEVPSNLIMHRVGARFWITRIMITWGALSVAMAFVGGPTSFYVMRLLLGAAEAGLFPGVMLYLTYWFGREQRARATGYFLLGVCIANIVGGPLAGALIELDGTLGFHGWQWLFVVEGIPAILLAFVVWTRLPDRPSRAPWLAPETGRALERALAAEQDAGVAAHGGHKYGAALRDPQIWLAIFVYFCHQLTIYTVIFFLPGIIGASGHFSPFAVGLLTALPWLAAALGAATLPRFARESHHSRRILCVGLIVMAAGLVGAANASPVAGLACVCVAASMFFVVQSIVFTFPASRLAGSALAGGLGLVNTCGLLGGFVGPTVVGAIEQATGNAKNGLTLLTAALVVAAFASLALRHGHERPAARSQG